MKKNDTHFTIWDSTSHDCTKKVMIMGKSTFAKYIGDYKGNTEMYAIPELGNLIFTYKNGDYKGPQFTNYNPITSFVKFLSKYDAREMIESDDFVVHGWSKQTMIEDYLLK